MIGAFGELRKKCAGEIRQWLNAPLLCVPRFPSSELEALTRKAFGLFQSGEKCTPACQVCLWRADATPKSQKQRL